MSVQNASRAHRRRWHGALLPLACLAPLGCGGDTPALEGEARLLVRDHVLEAGDDLRLLLETAGRSVLEVRLVEPLEEGRDLELTARRVETSGSRPVGSALVTGVRPGNTLARLVLPAVSPDAFELTLDWRGGDPVRLESLRLVEERPLARTSVIWINVDTFAARHSNVYGYPRETTPALARFAEEAVVFERARVHAPWTLPSTMSQLTGLHPLSIRIPEEVEREAEVDVHLVGDARWQIPDARWTLAEHLRAAGFRTAAFLDNPYLHPGFGFAQGFEVWDMESAAIERVDPAGGFAHMTPRVLDWLDGLGEDAPFFLFLQPFDPHAPYVPAPEHATLFDGDGLHAGLGDAPVGDESGFPGSVGRSVARFRPGADPGEPVPERVELGPLVDAYDRSIRTLDDALGAFLEALRTRGVLEHAVVVISSDHGESTTGHESLFRHEAIWEDVLHVPLLFRLPGGSEGGRRVPGGAQAVDIFPTLLELAGLDPERPHLHGISLVDALSGAALPLRDHFAYAEQHETLGLVRGDAKLHLRRPTEGNPYALLRLPEVRAWLHESLDVPVGVRIEPEELLRRIQADEEGESLYTAWLFLRANVLQPHVDLFDLAVDPHERAALDARADPRVADLRARAESLEAATRAAYADAPLRREAFQPDESLSDVLRVLGY